MPIKSILYEAIVSNISNGVYIVQGDGATLFLNNRMAEIFGHPTADGLMGKDLYRELFPDPQSIDLFRSANDQLFHGTAEVIAWGQPCRRADGEYFWMEVEARRIEVEGVPAIFGTILDRTDCKMIGEAMHVSQETLRLLLDAMEDRVYVVTDEYRMLYANRKMREGLLGDMEADPCYRVCRGLDERCEDCSTDKVFASDVPIHKEFFNQCTKRWYSVIELAIRMPGVTRPAKLAVARDVTGRKESEAQIRALSHRLLTAQEEERRHLSRELHDDLGQRLNAVKLGLEGLMSHCEKDDSEQARQAGRLCDILDGSINCVRHIAWGLRPPELERLGLVETMRDHCRKLESLHSLAIDFRTAGMNNLQLDPQVEINLFRILQEALHNVVKHAAASATTVRLLGSHPRLILKIEDNGRGFDSGPLLNDRAGLGIVGMAERVELLGGNFTIQSRPGEGTRISVEIPIEVSIRDGGEVAAGGSTAQGKTGNRKSRIRRK